MITCPPIILERIPDIQSSVLSVQYPDATAVGGVGDITLHYSIASGGDFSLGETVVSVIGVDSAGTIAQCTFPVFVVYEGIVNMLQMIY